MLTFAVRTTLIMLFYFWSDYMNLPAATKGVVKLEQCDVDT